MGRLVFALMVGAALVAASSAISQSTRSVDARTVVRTVRVRPSSISAFTLRCPSGYVAVSGGVSKAAPGATALAIHATGARTYAFHVGNPAGNGPRKAGFAVACRRIAAAPRFELRSIESRPVAIAAKHRKQVSLACPRGTVAAGAGFDVAPRARSAGRFGGSPLNLRRQTQTLRRFAFLFENAGRARRSVVVYGSCLTVVPTPGAARARLQVKVTTDTTPVQPGAQVVREACPGGWFPVATGYARPDEVTVEASFASSRGGTWSLRSTAASQVLADLQLVCARVL